MKASKGKRKSKNPPEFARVVLAIKGDWSSPQDIKQIGDLLYSLEGYRGPTASQWQGWFRTWWQEQSVEGAKKFDHSNCYRLSYADLHDVLSSVPKALLQSYTDAINQSYQVRYNPVRDMRLALYCGDISAFQESFYRSNSDSMWFELLGDPPMEEVFELLPDEFKERFLVIAADRALQLEGPTFPLITESTAPDLLPQRIALLALSGDVPAALEESAKGNPGADKTGHLYAAMTILELARNQVDAARNFAMLALQQSKGKKKFPALNGPMSVWVAYCAITGTPEQRAMAELLMSSTKRYQYGQAEEDVLILRFLSWLGNDNGPMSIPSGSYRRREWNHLTKLWYQVLIAWGVANKDKESDNSLCKHLRAIGFHWAAAEASGLHPSKEKQRGTLVQLYTPVEPWRRKLETLAVFSSAAKVLKGGKKKNRSSDDAEHRIVWCLSPTPYSMDSDVELGAILQKRGKKSFTKGRAVSANALRKLLGKTWIDQADNKVLHAIQPSSYRNASYEFGLPCLLALVGNSHVVWKDDMSPADVVAGETGLNVERRADSIVIKPTPFSSEPETLVARQGHKLVIYAVDAQHVALCEATGEQLQLPIEAEDELAEIMGRLPTSVSLNSDIAPKGQEVHEVDAEPALVVLLRRSSEVIRVTVATMPLGTDGPSCKPGEGKEVLVAEISGAATQTRRNLKDEVRRAAELSDRCPSLERGEVRQGEIRIEGLADTLSLLRELHLMGEEIICLWKEGEPMRVDLSADLSGLHLKFGDSNKWLSAEILVQVSSDVSLKAHELVERMVPGASQFVRLDDGRYIALGASLSSKLLRLSELGDLGSKGLRMAPANAYALSAWLGDLDPKSVKKGAKLAEKRLSKVREAVALSPCPPTTCKAELRSYQHEGYQWLSRLAHWGGGAMLCDDMGLGKTVQMLAVLADRGRVGPALVVAPVSVLAHWGNLMRQFTPTLQFHQLAAAGRNETISGLGPRDVLVVSYGLLHNEIDALSGRCFQTIILDEAQAIKNPQSRRAKAAFKLQGEFRVITTGTPIENNLGELWSLMNFANPGLLGTTRKFSDVYGKPIQNDGDREASTRLRKLISPFLLRRTKSQVLTELPPKTEITLEVEPGPEEAQFYSAVRDEILAKITDGLNKPAQQRIQILAALMKLRRIACHPSLVDATATCGSAKQETFLRLVEELRDAGHKILVFSQFVGHLSIAKANLEAKNISYQYLDGSTSKTKRSKAVEAFQNGEGDVFLISLKAGGVGLHLTAADYVIHLDPWWNPAVEDQASDRAHRMGQTRPVTVYRLVTKGTVEERVLELHARKRQLADDLIAGNEHGGTLGVQELMQLMQECAV